MEGGVAMEETAAAQMQFVRVPSAGDGGFARTRSFETEAVAPDADAGLAPATGTGGAMEMGLRAAFVRHFRRAANKATLLDGRELMREAMVDCSVGGTMLTSMPMQSLYCYRWTVAFHLAYCLVSCNKLFGCLGLLLLDIKCEGTQFRFTPLELRGHPVEAVAGPGVADMGLLYRGCGLGSANVSAVGDSLVASFAEPVGINGWWFMTSLEPAARDPVRFVLEASRDGATWDVCGASRFAAVPSADDVAWIGWRVAAHTTTTARGAVEAFGLEVPWQFALDHVLVMLNHGVVNLVVVANVLLHRPVEAYRSLFLLYRACTALYATSAAAYALRGNLTVAVIPAMYALLWSKVFFRKEILSHYVAQLSLGFVIAGVVQYLVIVSDADGAQTLVSGYRAVLPLDIKTAFSVSLIIFCCLVVVLRGVARAVADSRALVIADEREYAAAWAACADSLPGSSAMDGIGSLTRAIGRGLRPDTLRQRASPSGQRPWRQMPPIRSFERIFAQAAVAAPLLRAKVKTWALASGGMFPMLPADDGPAGGEAGPCRFERWDAVVGDGARMELVKWPSVKSMKRAVEKMYRCYAGDVSRLVDCCRCRRRHAAETAGGRGAAPRGEWRAAHPSPPFIFGSFSIRPESLNWV